MRSSSGNNTAVSEGVEASFIYVRFEVAADEVMILFTFAMNYLVTLYSIWSSQHIITLPTLLI